MSGRIFGAAAALLAALLAWPGFTRPLRDPDAFWLRWAGEALWRGDFQSKNLLSFTAPEEVWRLHEPLVALAWGALGEGGMGLVRGLVLSALALALLVAAARSGSGWAAVLGLAWAGPLVSVALSERAMAWGDALFAWTLVLLQPGEGARWRLWLAAGLVGIWANVHASFVIGVLVLGLRAWRFGLLAALLSLASPFGRGAWALAWTYGRGDGAAEVVHRYILEWTPLWPDDPAWATRGVLLALGLLLALRDPDWRAKALVLALAGLAIWHRRACDVFAIAALPLVARSLAAALPLRPLRGVYAGFAALVLPVALVAPKARLDPLLYPDEVLSALEPGRRAWTDIELGAAAGVRGVPVYWDARNDCYPAEILRDGVRVATLAPGWEAVLGRWEVEQVLTREPRLAGALRARGASVVAEAHGLALLRLPARAATDTLP